MVDHNVAPNPESANLLERAEQHDERASFFAQHAEAGSIQKAANHFVIAEGLRRLAKASQ